LKEAKGSGQILISNSLALRKGWVAEGGSGFVPSEVRKRKGSEQDVPVYLIASDMLNPALWKRFGQFQL
jgi:hypothetical protein